MNHQPSSLSGAVLGAFARVVAGVGSVGGTAAIFLALVVGPRITSQVGGRVTVSAVFAETHPLRSLGMRSVETDAGKEAHWLVVCSGAAKALPACVLALWIRMSRKDCLESMDMVSEDCTLLNAVSFGGGWLWYWSSR